MAKKRKKYLVKRTDGIKMIIEANFEPKVPIYTDFAPLPEGLEDEDPRWLQIETLIDDNGGQIKTVTIDQATKDLELDLDNQRQLDEAAKKSHEDKIKKKLDRIEFANRIRAEVALINDAKNWTGVEKEAYLENREVMKANHLLSAGSIGVLRNKLAVPEYLSQFYTGQEKADIIKMIDDYLAAESI